MNRLLYALIMLITLSSCVTKNIPITDFSFSPKNTQELIKTVNSKNSYPKWLFLKGNAKISKSKQDISFKIINRKDSVIWLSVSALFGIEIFRAQLTPDSIYFMNRITKTCLIQPASHINDIIKSDLSYYDIQDIINANTKIIKDKYKFTADELGFHLYSDRITYSFGSNYRIKILKTTNNKSNLEFAFDNYEAIDNFPRKAQLRVEANEAFNTTINYSKVEFNKPHKILFIIPESYHEIK